jgi:hypothetical protein
MESGGSVCSISGASTPMTDESDRITPLLLSRTLTPEELAYLKEKDPGFFCTHHSPVNAIPDWDADEEDDEEE